jgi:hypothetical protein
MMQLDYSGNAPTKYPGNVRVDREEFAEINHSQVQVHPDGRIARPDPPRRINWLEAQETREQFISEPHKFLKHLGAEQMVYAVMDGGAKPNPGKAGGVV